MPTRRFACLLLALPFAVPSAWAAQAVPAAEIVAAAQRSLSGPSGDRLTLRVVGAPDDAVVRAGRVALRALPVTGRWPRSRVAVPVRITVDGAVVRTETVWFAVTAERDVLVYAEDAPAGTPATAIKTRVVSVDVAAVQQAFAVDSAGYSGERLKRGVHAGAPVLAGDFEPIPDVDRQGTVAVHVRYGAIRMEATGRAMRAGNTGEVVPVLVDGAETPVEARVLARGEVEIEH